MLCIIYVITKMLPHYLSQISLSVGGVHTNGIILYFRAGHLDTQNVCTPHYFSETSRYDYNIVI